MSMPYEYVVLPGPNGYRVVRRWVEGRAPKGRETDEYVANAQSIDDATEYATHMNAHAARILALSADAARQTMADWY